MRHTYSDATTKRFLSWWADYAREYGESPELPAILDWLDKTEDYRNPMAALKNLCYGLVDGKHAYPICRIADGLISALGEERRFSETAEDFFRAAIRRVGIDDSEVNMFDGHVRAGTLHDLGLAKKEQAADA
jgi:hypothetical protein